MWTLAKHGHHIAMYVPVNKLVSTVSRDLPIALLLAMLDRGEQLSSLTSRKHFRSFIELSDLSFAAE